MVNKINKKKLISYTIVVIIVAFLLQGLIFNSISAGTITGILNASELAEGDIVVDTSVGIFQIKASATKAVTIQANGKTDENGNSFTNRLKLNGVGDSTVRSIHFSTSSASYVTALALSGSSSQDRNLALYNADTDELVVSQTTPGGLTTAISGTVIPVLTYTLEEAGNYYLVAEIGAVNIYNIQVEELGELAPRAEWNTVAEPVLGEATLNATDSGKIDVPWTMDIGRDGADQIVIQLLDESGNVVTDTTITSISTNGVAELSPPYSGNYTLKAEASRGDEEIKLASNEVAFNSYVQPLALPNVTKIKTGANSSAVVKWLPVEEAESYIVEYKTSDTADYTVSLDNIVGEEGQWKFEHTIPGLVSGTSYDIKISAVRGTEKQSTSKSFTLGAAEEVWTSDDIGSGGKGTVTENEDGSLTINATGGKIADSEDGFTYYYTEIDPATENFTLTAKFRIDDASSKDNQSGFGVIATDTLIENMSSARYFNSASAMFTKYRDAVLNYTKYGIPGGRFVSGYTEAPTEGSSNRKLINDKPFDWDFKYDYVTDSNANPPKFETGEEYTLTLRKSNTGYHAYMNNDKTNEVIYYGTDLLNVQEKDKVYVGMCVSRKIACTVLEYDFTTIAPKDDEAPQERPIEYTTPKFTLDTTTTTSNSAYQAAFTSNVKGTYTVADKKGKVIAEATSIEAKERSLLDLTLKKGDNKYIVEFTPASHEEQGFKDYEELDSYEAFNYEFTISYKAYGTSENSIYVSPNGKSNGQGSKRKPLDIYSAIAYAQPGQTIVLLGGTYDITESIIIARGNSGTADNKITLMSDPEEKAILDLKNSTNGGLLLKGDYWHIYNIDITNSQNNLKAVHIAGHNNIMEKCNTYNNTSTGIQISGYSAEPNTMWPSNNLVLSCESYNNCDSGGNDADGFAAKLTCGEGNVFKYCISHHNIDDGWDLYAKSTSGPIGVVTIDSCVAYNNGYLTEDTGNTLTGEGNGFKLGGESVPGAHILKNSISFDNLAKGITSNSGPDCKIFDSISYKNGAENLSLYTSGKVTTFELNNTISYVGGIVDKVALKNQTTIASETNYIDGKNSVGAVVSDSWFESVDTTIKPTIAEDGSIDMHGLLSMTSEAAEDVGASIEPNETPTEISVGTEIKNGNNSSSKNKFKKMLERLSKFWSSFFRWF